MTSGDVVYSLRFSLIKILPGPGFELRSTAGESSVLTARLYMLYNVKLFYYIRLLIYRVSARHQQDTSKAPARHQQGTSKAPTRHQQGTSKTPARHQQGNSKATARHQQGNSKAPARHQQGTSKIPARHQQDTSTHIHVQTIHT